jgi:hypothetical protein
MKFAIVFTLSIIGLALCAAYYIERKDTRK